MKKLLFILMFFLVLFLGNNLANASGLTERLIGRILLQVEDNGEAWYVEPLSKERFYLGRPLDAFKIMSSLGLGVSNADFEKFAGTAPSRLAGRILLRVEENGEAFYVNPLDLKMHFLGRPADAFRIMREFGLGITNTNLNKIPVSRDKEQACINSGGKVLTSLCCKTTSDFPNLCLIGACGCSPGNSHQVKICDCGTNECFNGSECTSTNELLIILKNLEQETGINFSEIQSIELKWVVKIDPKVEEVNIEGKRIEATRISTEQYDSIEQFLRDNGFEADLYNIADGTFVGLKGYKKDQLVCTVSGGATGYKEAEGQWIPPEPDIKDVTVKCGKLEITTNSTADWNNYTNEKYKYSFKYPENCLYGPLPGYCKQSPPEERPRECHCYLNATNPDVVSLETFTGPKDNLTGASFMVSHYSTEPYNPPAGTDLINWLKKKFSYQDIPDEINMEIAGMPAVKVYTPFSGMAWSQEDIYFIKNDKLFKIQMLNVDNKNNKELYNQILSTFSISE